MLKMQLFGYQNLGILTTKMLVFWHWNTGNMILNKLTKKTINNKKYILV
jgi:hypothetical protein